MAWAGAGAAAPQQLRPCHHREPLASPQRGHQRPGDAQRAPDPRARASAAPARPRGPARCRRPTPRPPPRHLGPWRALRAAALEAPPPPPGRRAALTHTPLDTPVDTPLDSAEEAASPLHAHKARQCAEVAEGRSCRGAARPQRRAAVPQDALQPPLRGQLRQGQLGAAAAAACRPPPPGQPLQLPLCAAPAGAPLRPVPPLRPRLPVSTPLLLPLSPPQAPRARSPCSQTSSPEPSRSCAPGRSAGHLPACLVAWPPLGGQPGLRVHP